MLYSTTDKSPVVYASEISCLHISFIYKEAREIYTIYKKLKFSSISEYIESIIVRFDHVNSDTLSCICNISRTQVATGSEKIINCRVSSENMSILKGYMTYLGASAEQVVRNFLLVASSLDMSVA